MKKELYTLCLADLVNDIEGHFYIMQALGKIPDAIYIDTTEHKILIKRHPLKGLIERFRMYRKVCNEANQQSGNKIVHFLTGDKFYFLPILFSPERSDCKVVLTLHQCPTHPLMILLLKNFARKISQIVVLSEFSQKKLKEIGVTNVTVIEHPTFYDYSAIAPRHELKKRRTIPADKIVISALGGTRFDKGLDLLLESFSFLTEKEKQRIVLNITGRVQDFDERYIVDKINAYHITAQIKLENVSDAIFCENVLFSDCLAIPYRKTFTGVSGPMAEALSQGIPCIVPLNSNLYAFTQQFQAAIPFEAENPASLAEAIRELITSKHQIHPVGIERLNSAHFIQKHIELYHTLF